VIFTAFNMTDRYAVIGNPISHSLSPKIHKMFAEQTGQDIFYEAIAAPLDSFAATIERLRKEGYKGCNVTVPFKFEAFQLATKLTERALAAKTVNTLKFDGDTILGDNTDGAGLVRDITRNLVWELQEKPVLLMGAGGASYGVSLPLLANKVRLSVVNRTVVKARQLAEAFAHKGHITALAYDELQNRQFSVVINATASGLTGEMPPLPSGIFAPDALAYDMMYGRDTPFMTFARAQGVQVADGLGMLIEQAAEAFYIWRGIWPDTAPVIKALRLP
jgi:shikimate dehydrogenase